MFSCRSTICCNPLRTSGFLFVIALAGLPVSDTLHTSEEELPGARDPSIQGSDTWAQIPNIPNAFPDAAVTPNVLVNGRELCPNGRGKTQNETSIAISGNVVVAAFNDSLGVCDPDHRAAVGWAFSLDNGNSWQDGGPDSLPNSRNLNNGDPWVGVSPDGQTFYLSGLYNFYQGFGFYRGDIVLDPNTGDPTGISWSLATVISFGSATHDKEAFVVDPNDGTIYLTYTRLTAPGGIFFTKSVDGGFEWIDHHSVFQGSSQGSFPALDRQGNLYVAYQAGGTIKVSKSVDGGDIFTQVASFAYSGAGVAFMDRSSQFPQLAIDRTGGPRDGWVYAVWHSGAGTGYTRPMISHTEDGGDTWVGPSPINTDKIVAHHWWPSVSVDNAGTVNVIYLDRRNNPGTGFTDLFLAQSTDGGNTFTDTQVTDVTSTWQGIMFDPGFTYAGDYIRCITSGSSVYAVWADPRNGDPDIYFARIDPKTGARNPQ